MNYLIYIEHSAENLQFFLWYKDYAKRFAQADTADIALSPEWTQTMEDDAIAKIRKDNAEKMRAEPAIAAEMFKGTDFEKGAIDAHSGNPFTTPPRTPRGADDKDSIHTDPSMPPSLAQTYKSQASEAFYSAGAKTPCKFTITIHPVYKTWATNNDSHHPTFPR